MDSLTNAILCDTDENDALHQKYLSLQTWTPKTKQELLRHQKNQLRRADETSIKPKARRSADEISPVRVCFDIKQVPETAQYQSLNQMKQLSKGVRKENSLTSETLTRNMSPTKCQTSDFGSDYTFNLYDGVKRVRFNLQTGINK